MNNRQLLADLINNYLDENVAEISPDEIGWARRNNAADVYHNIFSRVFLDIQNFYKEIRDSYRDQDIQNGYHTNFKIVEIRGSKVWTRRLYLRGIWRDFLNKESVEVTFSLDYNNLNQRTAVIRVADANIFRLFNYQRDDSKKFRLTYQGLFDLTDISKADRDGFIELHV